MHSALSFDAANSTYTLKHKDQTFDTFDGNGLLIAVSDAFGNQITIQRVGGRIDTVTDAAGRLLQFAYVGTNLDEIIDPTEIDENPFNIQQREWTFAYDPEGRVSAVTDPMTFLNDFQYDAAGHIIQIRDKYDPNDQDTPYPGWYVLEYEVHIARDANALRNVTDPLNTQQFFHVGGDGPFRFHVDYTDRRGNLWVFESWQGLPEALIDRVDLAELGDELLGIVIDYKRTRDKKLNMGSVYHGLSLQLVAYLLALAEKGETLAGRPIRPLAALYVSLASHYEQIDHPAVEISSRDEQLMGTYRARGLIAGDKFAALDPSEGTGWSDHYSVYVKKDGSIAQGDSGDAVDGDAMDSILARTKYNLGRLADGVLDGRVAVNPYRLGTMSPCSWCSLASVCRFEMGLCDVRFLDSLKRSEVFDRLAGQGAGGSAVRPDSKTARKR